MARSLVERAATHAGRRGRRGRPAGTRSPPSPASVAAAIDGRAARSRRLRRRLHGGGPGGGRARRSACRECGGRGRGGRGRRRDRRSGHPSLDRLRLRRQRNRALHRNRRTGAALRLWRTKLAGEQAVAVANPRHVILRTAWVYSPFGRNFVQTMLRLAADRDRVSVVSDQWGNPTSALDVADALLHMAERVLASERADHYGTFHMAGAGSTNWSGFASHIFAASRAAGGPWAEVEEIATADFPAKAARPPNSRLSHRASRGHLWPAPAAIGAHPRH